MTDRGMRTFTDDSIPSALREQGGVDANAVAFLAFQGTAYRRSPLFRQELASGFVVRRQQWTYPGRGERRAPEWRLHCGFGTGPPVSLATDRFFPGTRA